MQKFHLIENEQIGGGLLDYGTVFLSGSSHDDATKSTSKGQRCVTWKGLEEDVSNTTGLILVLRSEILQLKVL